MLALNRDVLRQSLESERPQDEQRGNIWEEQADDNVDELSFKLVPRTYENGTVRAGYIASVGPTAVAIQVFDFGGDFDAADALAHLLKDESRRTLATFLASTSSSDNVSLGEPCAALPAGA